MGNDTCASAGQFRTDALIHVHLPPRPPQQQGGEKAGHRTADHHRLWLVLPFPRPSFMSSPPFRLFAESDRDAPYLSLDQLWRCHCAKSTIIYQLINTVWETALSDQRGPLLG